MRKTLRNLLTAGTIGLASLLPMKKAEAQVSGNVEYIQSEKPETSFLRANAFYGLLLKTNGYTFMELHQNGNGYFGKTILNRPVRSGLGPKLEAVHSGEPLSRVGAGIGFSIPGMPKGSYASLGFLPIWISNEGRRAQTQYAFGFSLPKGFNLSGFGEMNLAAEGGPQWDYGEIELTKKLGRAEIGYNARLINDGNASPKHEHGLVFTLNFGGTQ